MYRQTSGTSKFITESAFVCLTVTGQCPSHGRSCTSLFSLYHVRTFNWEAEHSGGRILCELEGLDPQMGRLAPNVKESGGELCSLTML